jgi:hypothetical protein
MKSFALLIAPLLVSLNAFTAETEMKTFKDLDFEVEVLSYHPEKPKSYILIVPPTGGTNYIDRSYATGLSKRGHHVYVLSRWTGDNEYNLELEIHKRFYARSFRAIGVVLSQIPKNAKVGILGTSVGGLHASIAASRYPEISSAMIITAGAHIPSIIAHSDQEAMVNVWLERKKRYGLKDKSHYVDELNKVIELEALNRLEIKTPKKFGLVISSNDTTVPTVNQERLKSLWKPEKVLYKDKDHFWTIVHTWLFDADFIYDFFE